MKLLCSLLLLACFFSVSNAQEAEIHSDKKNWLYGIRDHVSKKWLTPAKYIRIEKVSKSAGVETHVTIAYIAYDKSGYRLIDKNGSTPIGSYYDEIKCIHYGQKLFVVKEKNQFYLFQIGNGILKQVGGFDSYLFFSDSGIAQLKKGNRFSFLYTTNLKVSPFEYEYEFTRDGDFFTTKKEGKYGALTNEGATAIEFKYDSLEYERSDFCGSYIASKNGKWGIINLNGTEILPFQYESINLGFIVMRSRMLEKCWDLIPVKLNGKWGIINRENKTVLPFEYDSLSYVTSSDNFCLYKNGKSGLVSREGKILFPFNYTYFEPLDMNLLLKSKDKKMLVNNGCKQCIPNGEEDGKWGISDSSGNIVQPVNASIVAVTDHKYTSYESYGISDTIGQQWADSMYVGYLWNIGGTKTKTLIATDTISTDAVNEWGDFYEAKIATKIYSYNFEGGKTGLMNMQGKLVLPADNEDMALPLTNPSNENTPYNSTSLKEHHKALGENYIMRSSEPFFAKRNGKWGMYTLQNNVIIKPAYDSIKYKEIESGLLYEMSDSILNAKGYHRRVVQAFENNNTYYYSLKGKLLYKQLANEAISAYITIPAPTDTLRNTFFDGQNYFLVHVDAKENYYEARRKETEPIYTYDGGEQFEEIIYTDRYFIPEGGKLNLLNTGTFKFLFPEPVEDLMIYTYYNWRVSHQKWMNVNNNKTLYFNSEMIDEPKEVAAQENHRLARSLKDLPASYSIFFFKLRGKWFLQNGTTPANTDVMQGFDSVKIIENAWFKAYINGKSGIYPFNYTGVYAPQIEMEFPELYDNDTRLVCNNCDYICKTIYQQNERETYDEYGYSTGTTTFIDTVKVPFVKKGKFNIVINKNNLVFDQWYDEIRIPYFEDINYFSLTDTSSCVYQSEKYYTRNYTACVENYTKSIALKTGTIWKLTTVQNPEKSIDGIESITQANGIWIVKKQGTIYEYQADNIWAEPKVTGKY